MTSTQRKMASVSHNALSFIAVWLIIITNLLCQHHFVVNGMQIGEKEAERVVDYNELQKQRIASKPWYARPIYVSDTYELPISPATIIAILISIIYVLSYFNKNKSYAVASHILLSDHSDDTKKKLDALKMNINNKPELFSKYAKEMSTCPSGKQNGGNLGKFHPGDMAPPFDQAVFNQQNLINTTIGPIETQFGYHLIYIQERHFE